jgi:hypothetical protein
MRRIARSGWTGGGLGRSAKRKTEDQGLDTRTPGNGEEGIALIQKKRHRIMRPFKKIDRNPNVCDKVDRLTQCHIKGSFYEQQ